MLVVKNLPAKAGNIRDKGLIPGLGRSPGRGHGNPPVFLPGKSLGQRSLEGYSPWGCKRVRHDWSDLARTHSQAQGTFLVDQRLRLHASTLRRESSIPGLGNKMLHAAAAATAKSLQSCPTLCDPIDGGPPGSPIPGILQAKTPEWVAIAWEKSKNKNKPSIFKKM